MRSAQRRITPREVVRVAHLEGWTGKTRFAQAVIFVGAEPQGDAHFDLFVVFRAGAGHQKLPKAGAGQSIGTG